MITTNEFFYDIFLSLQTTVAAVS